MNEQGKHNLAETNKQTQNSAGTEGDARGSEGGGRGGSVAEPFFH